MKLQNKIMLALTLTTFSLNAHAETAGTQIPDVVSYQAVGRAIENRATGEKIDLACLEIPAEGKSCMHFQLRYTDQTGKVSLVGSEVIMKTMPEGTFTQDVMDSNKTFYQQKQWSYWRNNKERFPIFKDCFESNGGLYVAGLFLGPIAGLVIGGLAESMNIGLIVAGSVMVAPLAADLIITIAPYLVVGIQQATVGIQRGLLTIPKHARAKKLKKAMHAIFDDAETTDTAFRINKNRFNFLKTNLTNYMN